MNVIANFFSLPPSPPQFLFPPPILLTFVELLLLLYLHIFARVYAIDILQNHGTLSGIRGTGNYHNIFYNRISINKEERMKNFTDDAYKIIINNCIL